MNGVRTLKVMSEAQFLAGEDARGVLVMLEPETALSAEHLDALVARGAAGFVSDFTPERFEKPDEKPALAYDREKYAALLAVAVTPRQGVRLRTLAGTGFLKVEVEGVEIVETVMPPERAKRDRSRDPEIGKAAILAALENVGVRKGDTLLVHASLSACGHVVGGAKTILDALVEAVGPDGNFFLPTFQRSECYLNGINKRWDHRPSDPRDRASEAIRWVGAVPLEFLRLYPDAPRGVHISHSWAGCGPCAAEILSHQAEDEPPFSGNSCPMVVKDMGGKILRSATRRSCIALRRISICRGWGRPTTTCASRTARSRGSSCRRGCPARASSIRRTKTRASSARPSRAGSRSAARRSASAS